MDYWRGPHAQLVARTPGLNEYRQHHFSEAAAGLWPYLDGVETRIPDGRRIDGMPEVWMDSPLSPLKGVAHNRIVAADERNVFGRTVLDITYPLGGRWYETTDAQPTAYRTVVLLRRRIGVRQDELRALVGDLATALSTCSGITEVRTLSFAPHQSWMWTTPGVAHDYPVDRQFHACLVVGARDEDALRAALGGADLEALHSRTRSAARAIHAYPVTATHTYTRDARPTLPQLQPVSKPRLDPVRRTVAPAPAPSAVAGLPHTTLIPLPGSNSEDVVIDHDGRLVCGVQGGAIVRIDPIERTTEIIANTKGRPLGLDVLADGRILVCDAHKGLLRVDPESGEVATLVQYVGGVPLRFCSNAVAEGDGTIWFTESTTRFDFEHYLGALLEHRPSGRLLRRDPDGTVEVVLDNLHFANGLTLTPDRTSLLFAETGNYSLTRLWLTGPRRGSTEPVLENLGGFPDNLSRFVDGRAWIALTNPRAPALDALADRPGILRKLVWRLPDRLQPDPETTVWAIAVDADGTIVDEVHGGHPSFHTASGAAEHHGVLYLASPQHSSLLAVALDARDNRQEK